MRARLPILLMILAVIALIAGACGGGDAGQVVFTGTIENRPPTCTTSEPIVVQVAHEDAGTDHDDEAMDHEVDEAMDHDDDEAGGHDDEAAFGADDVEMVIEIDMTEFAYGCTPTIPSGVVVALQFTNTGAIDHEAVIGDKAAQDDAEVAMLAMQEDGDMAHGHAVPSLTLEPGETGELIVMFDEPTELILGCHIPGHWDAGMHTDLQVSLA